MISETEFMDQVLQLAAICNWWTLHLRPAKTKDGWRVAMQGNGRGFPDLLAVRRDRLVVAELKRSRREKPTEEQQQWLDKFRSLPWAQVFLWTPDDWTEIERILA